MVRQELPEPNACGHCVRPVNIVYMLIGSSGLKQEARLLVAEQFTADKAHEDDEDDTPDSDNEDDMINFMDYSDYCIYSDFNHLNKIYAMERKYGLKESNKHTI